MQTHTALKWLVSVIGVLALLAASAGLFWPAQGQPFAFTTHRGEEVMIAGRGLYRYDTVTPLEAVVGIGVPDTLYERAIF